MKKGKIIAAVLLACILVLSFSLTACVPSKSSSSDSPAATTTNTSALEKRVASLESALSNSSSAGVTNKEVNQAINDALSDGDGNNKLDEITTLKDEIETLKSQSTTNIPRYAMVSDMSHRYVSVIVYGTGDFPVFVYLFGEDLKAVNVGEDWIVEAVEYREYDVVDVFLYGQPILEDTENPKVIIVPGQAVTSGPPETEGKPPNAHTHEVTIDGKSISVPSYTLSDTGTLLVIVVEPDEEWIDGYEFELDIQGIDDNDGWVDYATASVGVVN